MSQGNKHLIVLTGPTASGKTALSIEIATDLGCEIISADSRQIYIETSIGTAKPSVEELSKAKHHLINAISVNTPYNAGRFATDATQILNKLFENHDHVIVCGGSGLYIDALTKGMDEMPEADPEIREKLTRVLQESGIGALQRELQEKDRDMFESIDICNPQRLIRALEVIRSTGRTYTSFRKKHTKGNGYLIHKICLDIPREDLYRRINQRVMLMIENGLENEARGLYPLRHLNALQTVGYKEFFDYFEQKADIGQTIEKICQHTRNYAKRQITWFRRDPELHWMAPDRNSIMNFLKNQIYAA